MSTLHDQDVVAWAAEQVARLREGQFERLDIERLADEIADVGKSEQRELRSRMIVLLAHLLKWAFQPQRRGASWLSTIRTQRRHILSALEETPSLKARLRDPQWQGEVWEDSVDSASDETGMWAGSFPESCPWDVDQVLMVGWLPETSED